MAGFRRIGDLPGVIAQPNQEHGAQEGVGDAFGFMRREFVVRDFMPPGVPVLVEPALNAQRDVRVQNIRQAFAAFFPDNPDILAVGALFPQNVSQTSAFSLAYLGLSLQSRNALHNFLIQQLQFSVLEAYFFTIGTISREGIANFPNITEEIARMIQEKVSIHMRYSLIRGADHYNGLLDDIRKVERPWPGTCVLFQKNNQQGQIYLSHIQFFTVGEKPNWF